jgi:hypothetical protein
MAVVLLWLNPLLKLDRSTSSAEPKILLGSREEEFCRIGCGGLLGRWLDCRNLA